MYYNIIITLGRQVSSRHVKRAKDSSDSDSKSDNEDSDFKMSESESEISEEHSDDSEASSDFNPFGEDETDSDGKKKNFFIYFMPVFKKY